MFTNYILTNGTSKSQCALDFLIKIKMFSIHQVFLLVFEKSLITSVSTRDLGIEFLQGQHQKHQPVSIETLSPLTQLFSCSLIYS